MLYAKLHAINIRLRAAVEDDNNTYFSIQDEFKTALQDALKDDDVLRYNKAQLLQFVSWCSSYRPYQPHVILGCLSKLNQKRG